MTTTTKKTSAKAKTSESAESVKDVQEGGASRKGKAASGPASRARLDARYNDVIRPALKDALGLSNIMQVPRLEKIVVNVGVKEAVSDSKILSTVMSTLNNIVGQKSVKTIAKKSIAGFKIREGMAIGACVTLRGRQMYIFLDKFINLALPKVRDFQGMSKKLDGRGNYNVGIKEWSIFPEVDTTQEKMFGMNITFHTSARTDEPAFKLLKEFGIPFTRG
jgi:large subunit ribosomal protein L5